MEIDAFNVDNCPIINGLQLIMVPTTWLAPSISYKWPSVAYWYLMEAGVMCVYEISCSFVVGQSLTDTVAQHKRNTQLPNTVCMYVYWV